MTDAEYAALSAADSILSLLYYRERSGIEALDKAYGALLDEALRKVRPLTNAEERRRRNNTEASA